MGVGIAYPMYPSQNVKKEELYELEFSSVMDMFRHIKNTGVNAVQNFTLTKGKIASLEKEFILRYGKVKLTYNPIYISYRVE